MASARESGRLPKVRALDSQESGVPCYQCHAFITLGPTPPALRRRLTTLSQPHPAHIRAQKQFKFLVRPLSCDFSAGSGDVVRHQCSRLRVAPYHCCCYCCYAGATRDSPHCTRAPPRRPASWRPSGWSRAAAAAPGDAAAAAAAEALSGRLCVAIYGARSHARGEDGARARWSHATAATSTPTLRRRGSTRRRRLPSPMVGPRSCRWPRRRRCCARAAQRSLTCARTRNTARRGPRAPSRIPRVTPAPSACSFASATASRRTWWRAFRRRRRSSCFATWASCRASPRCGCSSAPSPQSASSQAASSRGASRRSVPGPICPSRVDARLTPIGLRNRAWRRRRRGRAAGTRRTSTLLPARDGPYPPALTHQPFQTPSGMRPWAWPCCHGLGHGR